MSVSSDRPVLDPPLSREPEGVSTRPVSNRSSRPHLAGRLVRRAELRPACRESMFRLLSAHFDGVDREVFERDLASKDYVILLEDAESRLQGFSTLHVYTSAAAPVTVIYSGDTIVQRDAWGSPALPRTWVHAVAELTALADPATELYWLLLTSGYRTYRFLPVFYCDFYPRRDAPTPPDVQRLIDTLAVERFGAAYHPADGVVRFPRPQVLKPDLLEVSAGRRRDRDVSFFLSANPGFVCGDELVCLTRMHEGNLTPAARRILQGAGAGIPMAHGPNLPRTAAAVEGSR